MSQQNKDLMRRIYDEIFVKGDLDLIDELVAEDAVDHETGEHGRDGMKRVVTMFRTAFPDLQFVAEDMIAEGDKVVTRARLRGTHKGEFMGIPATGKQVDVSFIDIVRFANGRGVEHWGVTDTATLMEQLGAAAPVGAP